MVAVRMLLLGAMMLSLAGCGGGSSSSGAETVVTVTTTETASTDTTPSETTSAIDTTATGTAVNVGDTATWSGDTFTVSDVETSDTAPAPDLFGETPQAENGIWLSFTITPTEDDSDIWSSGFVENMHINGGDGVLYEDAHNNGTEQQFNDEGDFLVWIDVPEAAVAGAVLEIYDGLHTVDPDPSNPFVEPVPDPAYATRVNLAP